MTSSISVLVVLLLGFTNGYLGSVSILIINEGLDEKDRGLAGRHAHIIIAKFR